jgi:hypothetical protein
MNHHHPFTEKTLTDEKTHAAMNPQAIPALVAAPLAAPIVLSQAPPISPSDPKPVVDSPSTITAPTLTEKK